MGTGGVLDSGADKAREVITGLRTAVKYKGKVNQLYHVFNVRSNKARFSHDAKR